MHALRWTGLAFLALMAVAAAQAGGQTWTVNDLDPDVTTTADGTCDADPIKDGNQCTFPEAVLEANDAPGSTIEFQIGLNGRIEIETSLFIRTGMTIDGSKAPNVILDGRMLSSAADICMFIMPGADGMEVNLYGLHFNRCPAQALLVAGDAYGRIGADGIGNTFTRNGYGLDIDSGSDDFEPGDPATLALGTIEVGAGGPWKIQGNHFGEFDDDEEEPVSNHNWGIVIGTNLDPTGNPGADTEPTVLIGGETASAGNRIWYQDSGGIFVDGAGDDVEDKIVIQNNFIGTDPQGRDRGNGDKAAVDHGIHLFRTTGAVVGGDDTESNPASLGNHVRFNGGDGIRVEVDPTEDTAQMNWVRGNEISDHGGELLRLAPTSLPSGPDETQVPPNIDFVAPAAREIRYRIDGGLVGDTVRIDVYGGECNEHIGEWLTSFTHKITTNSGDTPESFFYGPNLFKDWRDVWLVANHEAGTSGPSICGGPANPSAGGGSSSPTTTTTTSTTTTTPPPTTSTSTSTSTTTTTQTVTQTQTQTQTQGPPPDDICKDHDLDGMCEALEISRGTDPFGADTDGDGMNDFDEILAGRDPLVEGPGNLNDDENTPFSLWPFALVLAAIVAVRRRLD